MISASFWLHTRVVLVGQARDPAQHLRQVERLHADAGRLQQLLAVAHGVEGAGPRADRAQPRRAQPVHHAADAEEAVQVAAGKLAVSGCTVCSSVSVKGKPYWRRLLQTEILPQNASRRRSTVNWSRSSG